MRERETTHPDRDEREREQRDGLHEWEDEWNLRNVSRVEFGQLRTPCGKRRDTDNGYVL